jgi:4-oxalocrotonate tautomerase
MPLIQVRIFEDELTDGVTEDLIAKLTDAVCEATREELRPATWVLVDGVAASAWGAAGKPLGD